MKRIFSALLLVVVLVGVLASCSLVLPSPEIKEGRFDVSVTYEVNGETKTLDLVYVCEYDGVDWTLEGTSYRAWNGHFEGYEDGDIIEVCESDDGSKIHLSFLIYAEYFMGEPEYIDEKRIPPSARASMFGVTKSSAPSFTGIWLFSVWGFISAKLAKP